VKPRASCSVVSGPGAATSAPRSAWTCSGSVFGQASYFLRDGGNCSFRTGVHFALRRLSAAGVLELRA